MMRPNQTRNANKARVVAGVMVAVCTVALVCGCSEAMAQQNAAQGKSAVRDDLPAPPLPVLSPTGFNADAGDGRAYLRWNPQLEDDRVIGWMVVQLAPEKKDVTREVLADPAFVVAGLANGTRYTFAAAGVLKDGKRTPPSNSASATPRATGTATVTNVERGQKITVGEVKDVELAGPGTKVVFPDGQELIYDGYRPVDWKTRDGQHLIYPGQFGNGVDIGKFDKRGLPTIIPPGGLRKDAITIDGKQWQLHGGEQPAATDPLQATIGQNRWHAPGAGGLFYQDVQWGFRHPFITDPLTVPPMRGGQNVWHKPQVDGDRVTLSYWQTLKIMGYDGWTCVVVWETWWPIERERHGTTYHGFARLVEVQMPSAWKNGYQVMLNNGFGPGGSRKGVTSYNNGFRKPGCEVVDYTPDENRQAYFQHAKPPRAGYGYHMNMDCLQSSPLIFYDWGVAGNRKAGSMTITARGVYYHCSNGSSSYVEQGADGVWPNLAWDLGAAGKRTAVDTVEYLYAPDVSQPLPQRYVNARYEAYSDVSRRMGVQNELCGVSMNAASGANREGGPVGYAERQIAPMSKERSANAHCLYFDFWNTAPMVVDRQYLLDETYDCNPAIKAMCDKFHAAGIRVGYWLRPELERFSIVGLLSDTIPTAASYYGYAGGQMPNIVKILEERGIPLLRQNPHWIRRQLDGSWPVDTPYQWVPMSFASEWWDKIMWPSLQMSSKLGFNFIELDGGFAGLQGVDYSPMLAGKADSAVPMQPYVWRMFRTFHLLDLRLIGECTVGWRGGSLDLAGEGDEHRVWMYTGSIFSLGWSKPEHPIIDNPQMLHRLFQLYNNLRQDVGNHAVRRYAKKFLAEHKPPDWIELKDLRQLEPAAVTMTTADSPVGGKPDKVDKDRPATFTVTPWTWGDVIWHYEDGTAAVYPAYENVEWGKTEK